MMRLLPAMLRSGSLALQSSRFAWRAAKAGAAAAMTMHTTITEVGKRMSSLQIRAVLISRDGPVKGSKGRGRGRSGKPAPDRPQRAHPRQAGIRQDGCLAPMIGHVQPPHLQRKGVKT